MKTYFTFDIARLHDKKLEAEVERHMHAAHMKGDIKKARTLLNQLRRYDKAHGAPKGDYTHIEITQSGFYLSKNKYRLKLDLRKAS